MFLLALDKCFFFYTLFGEPFQRGFHASKFFFKVNSSYLHSRHHDCLWQFRFRLWKDHLLRRRRRRIAAVIIFHPNDGDCCFIFNVEVTFPLRGSTGRDLLTPSFMLESVLSVECKDITTTVLFVPVAVAALAMLLVTTPVLWLLKMMSELVDFRCKDPYFSFSYEETTLPIVMSSLQRCVWKFEVFKRRRWEAEMSHRACQKFITTKFESKSN